MESDDLAPSCSADWVAAVPSRSEEDRIVGTVQVVSPTALSEMPADHPLSRELRLRDHVAELRLLRVSDDMWRQGIGARLVEVAIDWCRRHGIRTLVLKRPLRRSQPSAYTTSWGSVRPAERFWTDMSWCGSGLSCSAWVGVRCVALGAIT